MGAALLGTLPAAADHNEPDQILDGNVKSCEGIVDGDVVWEESADVPDIIHHGWFTVDLSDDNQWLDVVLTSEGENSGIDLAVLVKGGPQTAVYLGPDLTHLQAPDNASGGPAAISNYTICKVHFNEPPTEEPTEPPTEEPTEPPTEEPTEPPTEEPTETPSESPSETPSESPSETPSESPSETPSETPSESPSETPSESPSETPSESPSETPGEDLPDTGSSPAVLLMAAGVLVAAGLVALRHRFVKP
ncbi:LPXTG cell wall anchor domain-containing protein [Jiangella endophytica]|uniref:LPXTG cell wall anchor domain-containing protein n=1 Tax=Jiangella endophytica TaxID=1623398 RepID=UPI000E34621C|nr:LPXTG cell wall anchor domain-containing protein [Jiangella endophytica]